MDEKIQNQVKKAANKQRKERLDTALRDNLKKRKQQSRARLTPEKESAKDQDPC